MNILALETTTKFLCIGIYKDGAVYEYSIEAGRKMSLLVAVTIKRVLDAVSLGVNDINYFVCGVGPGSFTGIRLGLATVKGLAFASRGHLIGVPTLEIIARNVPGRGNRIITLVDAKRDLLYCGIYRNQGTGLKSLEPDRLLTVPQAIKEIRSNDIITGDGIALCKDAVIKKASGVTILDKDDWYPKGCAIIALALEKIRAGISERSSLPRYLYPKECQVRGTYAARK